MEEIVNTDLTYAPVFLPLELARIMRWKCVQCTQQLEATDDGPNSYIVTCKCGQHFRIEWYHKYGYQTVEPTTEEEIL